MSWLRFGRAGSQRIKPLIREIREVEDAIRHSPGTTAVFVNSGARIERRRQNIGSRPVADHHASASFLRTRFEPVYVGTVEADFGEADRLGGNQVGSNG